jgi:hypothetical protein
MVNYIVRTVALIAAGYVVFLGLAIVGGVFDWVKWDEIWDLAGKVGIVAVIIVGINIILALLVSLLPKADANQKK